jgi:hypothetical protein
MLLFALAGAGCGFLFTSSGAWVGALGLVGVLAAVDVMVISRSHRVTSRRRHRAWAAASAVVAPVVAGGGTYALATFVDGSAALPLGMAAALLFAWVSTVALLRRHMSRWECQTALGVVISESPFMLLAALVGLVTAIAGWPAGVSAGVVAAVIAWSLQQRGRGDGALRPAFDDVEALALMELAFHDLSASQSEL